jgi:hypothetical protein
VIEIVLSTGQANPPKVEYAAQPFRPGHKSVREIAPVASPDYVRVLGSPAQNSRTSASPRSGAWHARWESPIPSASSAILMAGNRIVAQRGGGWTLFDLGGKQIAAGLCGRSVLTLDPSAGFFMAVAGGNFLEAIGLDKGDVRFKVPLGYNESFAWPLLLRFGKRIVAAGFEQRMLSPHGESPARSLFQVIEVGSPLKLNPYKMLLSVNLQQDLIFKESNMVPVASGEILWAAMPNLLIRTSAAQTIDGAWSDSFQPVAAAADEAGWLYLIVTTDRGRELWIVTPDGQRQVRKPLPPPYAESKIPPAIGYDHRVFLRTSQSVAAFSPEGDRLWEAQIPGSIAGLSVTPDGRLIVAAGAAIYQVDGNGKTLPLAPLSAPATTAPVVTPSGEILVGTETGVLCLEGR